MIPWLTDEYGNASQPYSFARKPKKALADARAIIAKCINTSPEEIYFTSGGTESNNWAIKGSAYSADYKSLIITSAIEHHSILNACASIEKHGFPIKYLVPDQYGIIFPEKLESTITNNTRLVSVMFSNNEIGTIEPIKQLVEVAHRCGALFHTDAVNAIGHTKIDVQDLGVDMLSASAHKFNGPKGIGFLYIKKGTNIIPYCDGGSQEFGMRAGTENIASIVGMATALKINVEQLQQNEKYMLMDAIIDKFGSNVNTYAWDQNNFRVIAEVAVGKVFFNWIFGFEGKVKIKAPEDVKQQYKAMVLKASENI